MTYLPFPTPYVKTTDTFSAVGTGPVTDLLITDSPMKNWTMVVVGTGGAATLWEVLLEGSLDGTVFSEILKHTTNVGDGQNLFSGTTLFPALHFRTRCTVLTLGAASDIVVTVLGQQ